MERVSPLDEGRYYSNESVSFESRVGIGSSMVELTWPLMKRLNSVDIAIIGEEYFQIDHGKKAPSYLACKSLFYMRLYVILPAHWT